MRITMILLVMLITFGTLSGALLAISSIENSFSVSFDDSTLKTLNDSQSSIDEINTITHELSTANFETQNVLNILSIPKQLIDLLRNLLLLGNKLGAFLSNILGVLGLPEYVIAIAVASISLVVAASVWNAVLGREKN